MLFIGGVLRPLGLGLLLLGLIAPISAIGFRRGRLNEGFLGEPSKIATLQRTLESEDLWFEQKLDHFKASDSRTWQQRYFVNADYYRNDSSAPIFLMIGGEGEASAKWMREGAWVHYAENFGALCLQLEHRFYGKSHPTEDLSTENLYYLSSEQALEDLANFVIAMKKKFNLADGQKWIAFGGSYPGSLAAWAREKYPTLIYGSISSSGPLLAEVDFREYFEVVKASLAAYKPECVDAVTRSFAQVEILLKHMIGQRSLDEKFKTCTPIKDSIENGLDMANFFENLAGNFAGVVQYNKDNSPHATVTIDDICDVMLNTTVGPPVTRLGLVNDMLLKESNTTCLDYKYEKMVADMKNVSWESETAKGMRQWTYQTCHEFGFYQTSDNQEDTFGGRFGVDFFIRQCMDVFSKNMDAKFLDLVVSGTNANYGALNPKTTNVLFVHGSIDPWHALGLVKSSNPALPTIYIEGTAHCANMYEPVKTDPPQLVAARNKILKFLAKLLQGYTSSLI
ncbi:putative serine protease K12H4.7 [Drosophila ficusphila]|uniref:putative serine protease K12H4.7 n=1 Tax=Drosophila ficusphila TaxID=30025 RepID=UPI0007E80870|nr:putative serine protease K12H4.7 [Drosophila ficusphila]XP_043063334.1 putative serine protease K12H4.7 [Drosophila ficusphila]